ncbi:MAG: hypothetical protein ACRDE5_08465 [Ginsengibacter sp.]
MNANGKLSATISIPARTSGVFIWKDKSYNLKNGETKFEGL